MGHVVCPYDNKHIVKQNRYARHIRTCPSRPEAHPCYGRSFIKTNCNSVASNQHSLLNSSPFARLDPFVLSRTPDLFQIFEQLIESAFAKQNDNPLISVYDAVDNTIPASFLSVEEFRGINTWTLGEKHGKQCCSIIQNLFNEKVLFRTASAADESLGPSVFTTIIEAGSGTGLLSAALALINPDEENRSRVANLTLPKNIVPTEKVPCKLSKLHRRVIYLVERERGYQSKYDRYVRASGEPCYRLPIDLRDFQLASLLEDELYGINPLIENYLQENGDGETQTILGKPLVGVNSIISIIGKHLCGGATDVTLRMAVENARVYSLGIALCCHAKSDGIEYCNPSFLSGLGIDRDTIRLMHRAVSWSLAFIGQHELTDMQHRQIRIGQQCRALLDLGRIMYLRDHGFQARIIKYAPAELTPERYLLCAHRPNGFDKE